MKTICQKCGCEIDEMADCCPGCLTGIETAKDAKAKFTRTERLYVESDGDRYPKDIYICDGNGNRVATMHGDNEQTMMRLAKFFARTFNNAKP